MTVRVGFGCASLGSRISPRDGLAALARAYDAGVDWYDVAPSYGDGQAEMLLGEFLRGRRESVVVCTKVGILPPALSLPKRLLRPAVRTALALAPSLRQAVRRNRPPALKPPLEAARIRPSLDASLTRLGTDRIDVLALHEVTPDEVQRDDVLRAIEDAITSGKALRVSVASSVAAALAAVGASSLYSVVQLANNPFEPNLTFVGPALSEMGRQITTVTHTVFGASGASERLAAKISEVPSLAHALRDAGYLGNARQQALAFLADYAFATNADGVVLLSMFGRGHLESNLDRVTKAPLCGIVQSIAGLIEPEVT